MENKPKYINLKEAAEISGYAPDYIGQLIRKGKLLGKQVYCNIAWVTTEEAIHEYLAKNKLSEQVVRARTPRIFKYLEKAFKVVICCTFILALGFALILFHIFSVSMDKKLQEKIIKKYETSSPPETRRNN